MRFGPKQLARPKRPAPVLEVLATRLGFQTHFLPPANTGVMTREGSVKSPLKMQQQIGSASLFFSVLNKGLCRPL